ncbi:MAG: FAD-binding protein [Planctomycetes bacterium]|jgi:FAD/FMN-containing dehydrogenase|nr:FAD-binding protein [Planctomycetota bacterium]
MTTALATASAYRFVEAWGMASGSFARVHRPRSVDEIQRILADLRERSVSLALRGTGNSYGDASTTRTGEVLEIHRMNRILGFDVETGIAEVEAGVTVRQLWRHILPLGYWPRVVSGTSFPTLAGVAAANIHGKNNFAVGTIGDAILEFDIVLPSGEVRTCSREQHADLFHGAIGGFGMLGVFSRLVVQTKRVHSGEMEVAVFANKNLREMMDYMETERASADYLVGWIDCFARGDAIGRGQVHRGRCLAPEEDPDPEKTRSLAHQDLSEMAFGVFPKSELWRIMRLLNNDFGMSFVNAVRYWQGRLEGAMAHKRWTLNEFSFLLDYVPNWKWSYGRKPGNGLIQFQPFVPKESAHHVCTEILRRSHAAGFVPYLGVFKRHRPDPFWLTHAVDGWSFAMDFRVSPSVREALWRHCGELTDLVLDHGGRFYFAKDLTLPAGVLERMYPADNLRRFRALKRELDPERLLQTDLARRVFGNGQGSAGRAAPP